MPANLPVAAIFESMIDREKLVKAVIAQAADLCGVQDARDRLATLPDLIRKAEERVRMLAAELGAAQGELEVVEATLMQRVMNETAGNGKPKYGNDAARRAVLTVLKAGDADYQAAAKIVRGLQDDLEAAKAERQYLRDEFAAVLAKARLAAAQMELAAAIVHTYSQ